MSEAEGPLEKRIKWDEEVINEHNKERGTRQKIDEPPTPYSYICNEEGDEESHTSASVEAIEQNWEALSAKLNYESEKQRVDEEEKQKRINFGEPPQHEDNVTHEGNGKKESSFAEKRASHYNEFFVLQAMRNAKRDEEYEDDES